MTGLILLLGEVALEYRAYIKGFDTLLLGSKKPLVNARAFADGEVQYGPTENFPFRSKIVGQLPNPEASRLWMASASYAAAPDVAPEVAFPNQLCEFLAAREIPCEMLNSSMPAWNIPVNIKQLEALGAAWNPDYIILYQMVNDIERMMRRHLSGQVSPGAINNGFIDDSKVAMTKLLQKTTIYGHVRNYIGTAVLFSAELADDLPEQAYREIRTDLNGFVDLALELGARPVLVTFLSQYNQDNVTEMPVDIQLHLLRYEGKLSTDGWMQALSRINDVIRQVAIDRNVALIDLASLVSDKAGMFKDLVHFTPAGHEKIASILADQLADDMEVESNGI